MTDTYFLTPRRKAIVQNSYRQGEKCPHYKCTYFASTLTQAGLHLSPAELLRSSALVLSRDRALNLSAKSFSKLYLAFLFNLKKIHAISRKVRKDF